MPIPAAFSPNTSYVPTIYDSGSVEAILQQQDFLKHINAWAQELAPGEARDTAAERIKEAYQKKSTELFLNNLNLSTLPENIGALALLTTIDISDNQLTTLPSSIGNLKKLEELHAQSNRLLVLPNTLCELQALQILILRDNDLKSLPDNIGELSCLEVLDATMNALETLPESIGNLKMLGGLHVSNNHLRCLPSVVSQLTTLVVLNASANQIDWVPSDIGDMPNLERLDLQDNRLFHRSFSLEHVEEVYLENNPVLEIMSAPYRLANFGPGLDNTFFCLHKACDYIAFEGWGVKNSCFINQLLQHAGRLQEQVQSRAMDNTVGLYVQRLRAAYFEIKEVAALIHQARDIDFLYDSEREDLVFIASDGKSGVIMGKDFYQANILGASRLADISWLQFSSYIFDEKKEAYTNVPIRDIAATLQPFPFLQKQFLAANQLNTLKNFLTQLNLGIYQELFIGVLYCRSNGVDLIAPENQTALIDLFSPMVSHENGGITITDTHFQTILNAFPIAANEPAATLFSLAMLMTRYSSQAVLGTELESPVALRHYALALLNKATQINPNLMDAQRVQNYRDSLLQRSDAQGCTEQLFDQMLSDTQDLIAAGNRELKTVVAAIVPLAWR